MKYKYSAIISKCKWIIRRTRYENLCMIDDYFTGYDFMGSTNWTDLIFHSTVQEYEDKDEAEQIIKDLESADM